MSLEVNWLRYVSRPTVGLPKTVRTSWRVPLRLPHNHSLQPTRPVRLVTQNSVGRAAELKIRYAA